MSSVILCNISDHVSVIAEERYQWTINVLIGLGVPKETIETDDIDRYREDMENLGIEVIDFPNGKTDIYKKVWHDGPSEESSGWLPVVEKNLVAQWNEPKYVKKIDGKSVYYEIYTDEWSILNIRRET